MIYMKVSRRTFLLFLWAIFFFNVAKSQGNSSAGFGYVSQGDSIQFIFGQQPQVIIGSVEVFLEKRIKEIQQVNIAGDFNSWNPNDPRYQMTKAHGTRFTLTMDKAHLGKKGETRQFKYVLNHTYWVEPPRDAPNQFTGKDGNTNLTLRLY